MKILTIKFKNINNLKGENEISFEDDPLRSAGIFAITGPTGSGKSTLLDVITLALFNKIPRFKGSISKSSIEGMGSVVTHHMDEASASITYEIHNQKYTSSWTVGKTRTGKLKDYEMFIYDANGTPLDLKKSEVPGRNEEIIGLKYDQFVKSIILSQGQFSRFLKADKSERGQLLENLTGASIYRKISIAAYDKYKVVRGEVALEKDRLENIQVLSDEERIEISEEIKTNGSKKIQLDTELEQYNIAKQVKSDLERMSALLVTKKGEKQELASEKEKYKEKLSRLDVFDKLSPILGELTRYNDAKINQTRLTKEIASNEKLLIDTEASRNGVVNEMSTLTGKTVTIENFNTEMSDFEKEVNALIQGLAYKKKLGDDTRDRIRNKVSNHRVKIDAEARPNTNIPILEKNLELCDSMIRSAGLDINVEPDVLNESGVKTKEELSALRELHQVYNKEALAINRIEKATEDFALYVEEEKKYAPLVSSSQKLLLTLKENIALLEKQRQDALLIASLTDHRSQLVDGEPCPLCGATDHPFSVHEPNQDSNLTQQLQKVKDEYVLHENEFAKNSKKLTENQASRKLIEEQIKLYQTELEKVIIEKEEKYKAYTGAEPKEQNSIEESIKKVEQKLEQLAQVTKALQSRSVFQELVEDFEELKNIGVQYIDQNKQLKEKYTGNDVSKDCNLLQDRFVRSNTRLASLNTVLENSKKDLSQITDYIDATIIKLSPRVKELGFETIEETAEIIISDEELKQLKSKKEDLNRRSTAVETEIKTLLVSVEKNQKLDTLPSNSLLSVNQAIIEKSSNREELIKAIGEKTAILQKDDQERARIKSKESELKKLQDKLDKWSLLNKMIGAATGDKFANFAQGLTLQNLLVYANKRLQKLSDRYLLDKPIKDGALTIIDQYQGNIQRSVATLSGGESFLISLALALSLSDMASKNVNLESLFIDEGFGTLDHESLDIAMNTLEKLQTESQKTVGVISHVEALKERIHVQIKLDKNAQGYGRLKVEG